jgi:hypothetical protein
MRNRGHPSPLPPNPHRSVAGSPLPPGPASTGKGSPLPPDPVTTGAGSPVPASLRARESGSLADREVTS